MSIPHSELILNPDGSIYHLNLLPEDIAHTVLLVGDPDRVSLVSQYFDIIRVKKQKREFVTHTGTLNGKELTVISTGIGTDNIDIVLNELDALVNIDFETRSVKQEFTTLRFIRLGTSGSLQPDIPVNDFLISTHGLGFDNLLHFYKSDHVQLVDFQEYFVKYTNWYKDGFAPYIVPCSSALQAIFETPGVHKGCTATAVGFYGPQSRKLRLEVRDPDFNEKLTAFAFKGVRITNLEMETAGIYGLSALLGHQAVSLNCILANRPLKTFSSNPKKAIDSLIQYALEHLAS
ncbi:nucleoside phosphorylase [Ascidiimonas aurantiaca]|uniref:nucleoside phosphorylase n=1 Tax=Ascidiimonas aurantiaca TaxID=1685432 RepID=UPI0030EB1BF4